MARPADPFLASVHGEDNMFCMNDFTHCDAGPKQLNFPNSHKTGELLFNMKSLYGRQVSIRIIEEGREAITVKVLIKNLAIFFLRPSKQFLPISFQIQLLEYFPQKQKEQRHKQLRYADKLVTTHN